MIAPRLRAAEACQIKANWRKVQETFQVQPLTGSAPEEMIVALLKDMSYQGRMSQARSTGRLNSLVPVAIEWTEAGGKMRAEGSTVDISAKGWMAVVPQGFTVGQKLGARRADRMGTGAGVAGSLPRFLGTRVLGIGHGHVRMEPGSASRFSTANRCAPSTFSLPFGRSETYISLGLGGFLGKTPTYGNPVAGSRWQDFARAGGGRNR